MFICLFFFGLYVIISYTKSQQKITRKKSFHYVGIIFMKLRGNQIHAPLNLRTDIRTEIWDNSVPIPK